MATVGASGSQAVIGQGLAVKDPSQSLLMREGRANKNTQVNKIKTKLKYFKLDK